MRKANGQEEKLLAVMVIETRRRWGCNQKTIPFLFLSSHTPYAPHGPHFQAICYGNVGDVGQVGSIYKKALISGTKSAFRTSSCVRVMMKGADNPKTASCAINSTWLIELAVK